MFSHELTHSGQKQAYGDTFREYKVLSDLPMADVESKCVSEIHKAIPYDDWLADYRAGKGGMDHAFAAHYKFKSTGENEYFFQVITQYTG